MAEEPYSRVYWRIQDEYPEIFDDPSALGTWLRLLMIAEGAYPAHPTMPRHVRPKPLKKLAEIGLVLLLPGDRYDIKGLKEERERRAAQARKAAQARWGSNAPAMQTHSERSANAMPRRDETSKDETRRALTVASDPRPIAEILPDIAARFGGRKT